MDRLRHYRRLLDYDDWANREALGSINSAEGDSKRALRLLAHIIGTQWTWLRRLGAPSGEMAVWPHLEREDCETQFDLLSIAWERYLEASSEQQLDESLAYLNSKGQSWSSRVEDILEHVIMHGAYHRGQIAFVLRADGSTPAYTDFIQAARSGAL